MPIIITIQIHSNVEFLYLCEYFNITPAEFFDDTDENPAISHELTQLFVNLDYESKLLLLSLARKLAKLPG